MIFNIVYQCLNYPIMRLNVILEKYIRMVKYVKMENNDRIWVVNPFMHYVIFIGSVYTFELIIFYSWTTFVIDCDEVQKK